MGDGSCFLCESPAALKCVHCPTEACSEEHLAVHRPKDYCFPFKVMRRPEVGRYVVATRDVAPSEIILEENPAVFGPEHDTPPVCLECLTAVDGSFTCAKCGLPLCGEECASHGRYHKPECEVFSDPPSGRGLKVVFGRERSA